MAEAKGLSNSDLKQSTDAESSASGELLEAEAKSSLAVPKTKDEFRQFGKNYIANVKASLLSSSASFNRDKCASTFEDPYMKAYRYLEENKVLALLEDLITYTAFQRPNEPFPFMAKLVEDFYSDRERKDTVSGENLLKTD